MKARQRNKLRKNTIIRMDIQTLPNGMDIHKWYHTILTTGIIFWDSFKGGLAPTVFPKKHKTVFKIKDKQNGKDI